MIIYNVSIRVAKEVAADWLEYMRTRHIPEVIDTGCFLSASLSELIDPILDAEAVSYVVQYRLRDVESLDRYQTEYAPALQRDHIERYGERALAYRTIMRHMDTFIVET